MALATPVSNATSFNITANTVQLDLSAELAEMIRSDNTVFISRLGEAVMATQTRHYWNEDKLNSNIATLDEALDASETDVDVLPADYNKFKIGTIFKFKEKGKSEVCRVTALPGSPTLTVERGHGSTSGETHANGAKILIIAHTRQEDQNMDEDDTQERSSVNNLTQIFQRGVRISYTREKIDTASGGIASEFAHQVAYRMKEEMRSLDASVINSVKSASAGSASDYRSMAGLIEFVSATNGNVVTTVENLTETVVNDLAELIVDDAGAVENGFMLVSPKLRRIVSTFDEAARRGTFDQTRAGYFVEKFITDMGFELEVIQDPWVPDDVLIIGDISRVKLVALQSDQMRFEELAKLGRSYRGQITGQYSLEVRNALEAFAFHNNLS
jgi:hypothetical protein